MRTINGFPLTDEQNVAVDLALTGEDLKISARAGAGKTSTLKAIAEAMQGRGLYIAFNKSIADEAAAEFPRWVKCKTAHSIAYARTAPGFRQRLQGRLTGFLVAEEMGLLDSEHLSATAQGYVLMGFVARFCQSAADVISMDHAPWGEVKLSIKNREEAKRVRRAILEGMVSMAQKLWDRLSMEEDGLPITHDVYLKLWALGRPRLNYQYILVDESQDLNGVLLGVLLNQRAQVIYVGDHYQQIYSWRGAVNAMQQVKTAHSCEITQSFRFGADIALAAGVVLMDQLGERVCIRGFEQCRSQIVTKPLKRANAVLCRTNREVITQLMLFVEAGLKPAVVGGVKAFLSLLYGCTDLMEGKQTSVPELSAFDSWAALVEFSESEAGQDFKVLMNLINQHGLDALIRLLRKVQYNKESEADIVISTAHKSKGREWDSVVLADDFRTTDHMMWRKEDANLLYVAVTRARKVLDVSDCEAVLWALDEFKAGAFELEAA